MLLLRALVLAAPAAGFVAPSQGAPALRHTQERYHVSELSRCPELPREWGRGRVSAASAVAATEAAAPEASVAAQQLTAEVLKALSAVVDPDLGQDIVTLGFVKGLKITESSSGAVVSFDVELTTPACPIKEQFRDDCKSLVEALPGVALAEVTMTAQAPRPAADGDGGGTGMSRVSNIVAVSSCKGGVGKSTTAVNLAYALHKQGARVGILDADIHGPSLPTMVKPESSAVEFAGNQIKPLEAHGVKLMSYGYVNPGAAIMRGPMVVQLLQQFVGLTSWGELDYLVIDMPPGTGDVQLTLCQALNVTAAVVVTTPQRLSFADVVKGIDMFDAVSVPSIAVVENMAYYEPPHASSEAVLGAASSAATGAAAPGAADLEKCLAAVLELSPAELRKQASEAGVTTEAGAGEDNRLRVALAARAVQALLTAAATAAAAAGAAVTAERPVAQPSREYLFGRGHAKRLADMWGIENTFQMPLAPEIARLGDSGLPLVVAAPEGAYAKVYATLATSVVQEVAKLRHGGGQRPRVAYNKAEHAIVVELPAAAAAAAAAGAGDAAPAAAAAAGSLQRQQRVPPAQLRRQCRCAACVEELTGRPILRPEDVSESIEPLDIQPVGNYAVAVGWSDGHKSLYPYAAFVEGYTGRRRRLVPMQEEEAAVAAAAGGAN